jgi:hypothetical protein
MFAYAFHQDTSRTSAPRGGIHPCNRVITGRGPRLRRVAISIYGDSRPLYYRAGRSGRGGNWVDGRARQGMRRKQMDEKHHLAR